MFAYKLQETVFADIGSDDNLMDAALLAHIKAAGAGPYFFHLPKPLIFTMDAHTPDGSSSEIVCTHTITIDTVLRVHHGISLNLRSFRWIVTEQTVGEHLLGRPLLEELGLHARDILSAAADRYAGAVNVSALLNADAEHGEDRISRVLEGVFSRRRRRKRF